MSAGSQKIARDKQYVHDVYLYKILMLVLNNYYNMFMIDRVLI